MAVVDGHGTPYAVTIDSASRAEVHLVEQTLEARFAGPVPERLIGDKAYDSDAHDRLLRDEWCVDLIAPHRSNRKHRTQDGRLLRRYKRRWQVERFFAWLLSFRRIAVRWEHRADNYLGLVQLACILILLRRAL